MHADQSMDLEGDPEIVELELAEQDDPPPATTTRDFDRAGVLHEVDSAAIFTLTIVALVLPAVVFVQMPRESVFRCEDPVLQSDAGQKASFDPARVPLNPLRTEREDVDADLASESRTTKFAA